MTRKVDFSMATQPKSLKFRVEQLSASNAEWKRLTRLAETCINDAQWASDAIKLEAPEKRKT